MLPLPFRLLPCLLLVICLAPPAWATPRDSLDDLLEMSERLDQLDRAELDELLRRAAQCTQARNFQCSEAEIAKAKKFATGGTDRQAIERVTLALAGERRAVQREIEEEARRRREEEERRRREEEAEEEAEREAARRSNQGNWLAQGIVAGLAQSNRERSRIDAIHNQMVSDMARNARARQQQTPWTPPPPRTSSSGSGSATTTGSAPRTSGASQTTAQASARTTQLAQAEGEARAAAAQEAAAQRRQAEAAEQKKQAEAAARTTQLAQAPSSGGGSQGASGGSGGPEYEYWLSGFGLEGKWKQCEQTRDSAQHWAEQTLKNNAHELCRNKGSGWGFSKMHRDGFGQAISCKDGKSWKYEITGAVAECRKLAR